MGTGSSFSSNGGKTPLLRVVVYEAFYAALRNNGIDEAERKRRNISFHGWRHFFNTTLRMGERGGQQGDVRDGPQDAGND